MSKSTKSRIEALERALHLVDDGAGLHFIWMNDGEPLYTYSLGDERRYFSLEQVQALYPRATVTDMRWIDKAVQEAKELKAQDEYAGTIYATWWMKLRDKHEQEQDGDSEDE